MANVSEDHKVDLDHRTSQAVCDSIGERLRETLKPGSMPLPHYLQELVDRFKDVEDAPSIIPDLRPSR
jgi:hypothetical protein